MVSRLNEAQVLDVALKKEFSVQRDRVLIIGEKCIYIQRNTLHIPCVCGPSQKARAAPRLGVVSFYLLLFS